MKKIFKVTFGILLLLIIVLYLGVVCILPSVINSKTTINKLQFFILNKTGAETTITGLNLKISPKLNIALNVDSIDAKNNDVSVADIKNIAINYKVLQKNLTLVSANNIFIDGNYLKQLKKKTKKENKRKFEIKNIPEIHIQKFVLKSDEVNINVENLNTNDNVIELKATINSPFLKEPLELGNSGSLEFAGNKIKANKFKITIGNSHLYLDGFLIDENKTPDFNINGENLPVAEIMPMLLYFQKSKDPSKKFLENFKNFNGTVNVDLKINKDGIWGKGIANNLSGNAVWFNIPIYFKEAVFNFKGQTIDSVAEGILGNEKVIHTLNITDLTTPQREVVGTMKTTLTKKFNYVPNLTILNAVNAGLVYKVKDKKPDVYYNVEIPVNSDLIYNSFYLGLRDYKRKIYANTFKDGNDLYLREYKYSYFKSNKENAVIFGDGLFSKHKDKNNPDKFIPQYLTVRTNGYAPTSVIGSFGEKINGGEFKGDLKYDFVNNQVLGTFDIIKAGYNAFRIDNAHIVSKNRVFNITSDGLYNGEKYSAELSLKNNIFGETYIYNMKLFIDKLIFETTQESPKKVEKTKPQNITKNIKEAGITINNWEIAINEIKRDKFILQNVKLLGSMKNNIFKFKMQELNFADGTVNANGMYDFSKDKSKMTFEAKNINSDKAANMMLNLEHQIEGTANAKVELEASDMFKYIDAHCAFEVKEGFMPKFGNTEFTIKNTKYKISEITNVDLTKKDDMKDDINGTFDVHNSELKNINITTWHELSAMFLEGSYEMEKQYADLQLFWHYSKEAPKGARVFGIPLSLILKVVFRPEHSKELYESEIQQIPQIKDNNKNSNYYRIHLEGDINNNKINLVLKEIR